jgi:hypothetical protein
MDRRPQAETFDQWIAGLHGKMQKEKGDSRNAELNNTRSFKNCRGRWHKKKKISHTETLPKNES